MLSIRRVVTQKSCPRWEHVAVALPFARNYTFKPCVMHIERLIKVTDAMDASGNYTRPDQARPRPSGQHVVLKLSAIMLYDNISTNFREFAARKKLLSDFHFAVFVSLLNFTN